MNLMVIQVFCQQRFACDGYDRFAYGWAGKEACSLTTYAINVSLFDFTVITYNTNSH